MTIREWAMDYCLQRGMPPTSAKAVLQRVDLETNKEMQCPWEWDTTNGYSGFHQLRHLSHRTAARIPSEISHIVVR